MRSAVKKSLRRNRSSKIRGLSFGWSILLLMPLTVFAALTSISLTSSAQSPIGPTNTPIPTRVPGPPDLVIRDIVRDSSYYKAYYCNTGQSRSNSPFVIQFTNAKTSQSFTTSYQYPFSVPNPGMCAWTGGLTCGLIGSSCTDTLSLYATVDPQNTVFEINEQNNVYWELFGAPTTIVIPPITGVTYPNLLQNPSFEADKDGNGRPDSWTGDSHFRRSTVLNIRPVNGTYVGVHQGYNNVSYLIEQTVKNLTAGKAYDFTGFVNIPNPTKDTFSFKIQVRWRDAQNSILKSVTIKDFTTQTNGWTKVAASLVPPAGTTNAKIQMRATSLSGVTIYVDNFHFFRLSPS